jgi:hypothetical protein
LIRQHRLDPARTKSYALEHLAVKSLRDASREHVSELIAHLQKRLFEDRDELIADLAKVADTGQRRSKNDIKLVIESHQTQTGGRYFF